MSYAEMIRTVKSAVRDEKLSDDIITRRAKSGNIILEILEKDHADKLASALRARLGEKIGIRRPVPSVGLLIIGIEDSVEDPELRAVLSNLDPELQSLNPIVIRQGKNGIRSAVIRAGIKLAEMNKIKIGWSVCKIKRLDDSARSCNKCKEKGHSASSCKGAEKHRCFRCKESGHLIVACSHPAAEPSSVLITDKGRETVSPSCSIAQDCVAHPAPPP